MLFAWCRKLFRRPVTRPVRRSRSRGYQPIFDALEDRLVPSFMPPVSLAAGYSVSSAAVGDFNGDGKMDIVTVGNLSGRGVARVELNNGDGTYTAGALYPTGNNPVKVKVGDFDGDGHQDIVTLAAYYTGALTTLRGNGDGSFQPATLYTVLTPPTDVEVQDVDGDGHPDIVAVNDFFNTVSEFRNRGDGTFGSKIDFPGGTAPYAVAVADFNRDGKPDLLTTNLNTGAGGVGLLLGNGTGGFQTRTGIAAGVAPFAVTVGDFNGDGNPDVAVANSAGATTVNVLLGNGNGTFQAAVAYNIGYQPLDIQQGDFNGDGKADLIERTTSGFVVEAGNGDGTFQAPLVVAGSAGNSTLVADFNGDGVADIASSNSSGTVTVQINANDGLSAVASASGLQMSVPATAAAGLTTPVTVSAVDANGNVATTFTGTVTVTTSDPLDNPAGLSYTFTAADAGVHTFNVPFYTLGTQTVTATEPLMGTVAQVVTVTPAPPARFAVTAVPSAVAGAPTTLMVIATDFYGNMVTNYTGTVHFSSSDAQAGLPADYTFTAADGGDHTFTATLKTAGLQSVSVADTTFTSVGGSGYVSVSPAAAAALTLSGGGGFIGSAHAVMVTAVDPYGNTATGYSGTVHLTSSDPNTVLPADTALVNGVGNLPITPMTLGVQSLTATDAADPSITGSESVTVTPGWAARFVMTPAQGTTAGVAQTVTVTAYDAFGNVSTVYTGTVRFASSDLQLGAPYYTFGAADQGVHTFSIAFKTAGSQTLTLLDAANPAATSPTQTGIVITPAAAASLSVSLLHGVTAGTAQTFTVTAKDAYGNVATGYRGPVAFGSSDTKAALPAAYTFTAADAGTHTFSMTFKSSGGQTFSVQDTANAANPAFTSFQRDIAITAAAVASFVVRAPSNATAGVAFSITVQAVDAFGNVVTGYTGKVHFTGTSGGGNLLPADYTFTAADNGSHVFSVTFVSTGTQAINVADLANGALKGSTSVKVVTQTTSGGGGTGGGGTGGGGTGGGRLA